MDNVDRHLMRTCYRTDVTDDEPGYAGMFSATIPASAFRDGHIVDVDWDRERGFVWVTFLIAGRGHDA